MTLEIGKFKFEGRPDELLTFWIGYEMRDQFKDILLDDTDDPEGSEE